MGIGALHNASKSDNFFAYPCHLSQILEEEERQSSRNSVEKESDTPIAVIKEQDELELEEISAAYKCDSEESKNHSNVKTHEEGRKDNIETEEQIEYDDF